MNDRSLRLIRSTAATALAVGLLLTALAGTASAGYGAVPEVDAGSLAGGFTVLSGALLILTNRSKTSR
jgi:hypothetical protein